MKTVPYITAAVLALSFAFIIVLCADCGHDLIAFGIATFVLAFALSPGDI